MSLSTTEYGVRIQDESKTEHFYTCGSQASAEGLKQSFDLTKPEFQATIMERSVTQWTEIPDAPPLQD